MLTSSEWDRYRMTTGWDKTESAFEREAVRSGWSSPNPHILYRRKLGFKISFRSIYSRCLRAFETGYLVLQ